MSTPLLIAAIVFALILVGAGIYLSGFFSKGNSSAMNMMSAQRGAFSEISRQENTSKQAKGVLSTINKPSSAASQVTVVKRLKYGQWKMKPSMFTGLKIVISIVSWIVISRKLNFAWQLLSLSFGPYLMNTLLQMSINKRFKAFDRDYPQFLLQLVGLLKTGMNPMGGLEAAALGLEETALVRTEVIVMLEKSRLGVSEDRSIGEFGDTIMHPEIELFVQALLLSKRVGGTLSDTLERLSKQVRKRQYFREAANAAVGLQRGSMVFILGILVALEVYLYFAYPAAITDAWADPIGWTIWQYAGFAIAIGYYWSRKITEIRV